MQNTEHKMKEKKEVDTAFRQRYDIILNTQNQEVAKEAGEFWWTSVK